MDKKRGEKMTRLGLRQHSPHRSSASRAPFLSKGWPALIVVFMLASFLAIPPAYGQTPSVAPEPVKGPPVPSDASGVDELIRVLIENGTINKEQASALMEKKGQPGFSPLSALTELLKTKGVITPAEADRVASKARIRAGCHASLRALRAGPREDDRDRHRRMSGSR